ncbi:CPBP family intramembrane glutamic endopeptidase [Pediococcus siamensis]|uniref:CPBP family intramembrane glutamic endopeptidase n=1 Tax=Pediococcus siamensis TaxID=381829 RepID=UPI00399F23C6
MSRIKPYIIDIAIVFILMPSVLLLSPTVFNTLLLPKAVWQLSGDFLAFFIALSLNKFRWKIKINFFKFRHSFKQLMSSTPALILLLLTTNFSSINLDSVSLLPLLTTLGIAFVEEFIFRGLLIPMSDRVAPNKPFIAVLISSTGFAFAHIGNLAHISANILLLQILLVFATGLLWAAVYIKTNNLVITIAMHFLSDIHMITKTTGNSSGLSLSGSQTSFMVVLILVIVLVCLCIAFMQVHKFNKPWTSK